MRSNLILFLIAGIFILLACQTNPYRQGKDIYNAECGGCHALDGSGLAKLIPALDTAKLKLHQPLELICLIRNGLPFDSLSRQQMPANRTINEVEMTNLINYLGTRYINSPQVVRVEEVQEMYNACQTWKHKE